MYKLWLQCVSLLLAMTLSVCAQDDSPSAIAPLSGADQDTQELLLAKAVHLYEEGDFAKALVFYNQLIARYPDTTAAVTAQAGIDQIMQTLGAQVIPQLAYQKLVDALGSSPTYQTIERAIQFMHMFPDKKQFTSIQSLLGTVFESVSMRYMATGLQPSGAALVYNGLTTEGGQPAHRFTWNGTVFDLQVGDRILYYEITSYDPVRGIELTSLDNLPYRLKEKHTEQQHHYFSAQMVHFQLKTVCTARVFFDQLTTRRGYQVWGAIDESVSGRVTVAVPSGGTVRQIAFEDDAVAYRQYRSVSDGQSILEKSYESFIAGSGNDQLKAKLRYFIEAKQWYEALGFYLWMIKQSLIDRAAPAYLAMYQTIEQHIAATTLPDRLLEYAVTCIGRDQPVTAITELAAIINTYPADAAAMEAHNYLVRLAHRPEFVLGAATIAAAPFTLTFMGFNIVGESQYMNQVNYKNRTYFVGQNESIGGFRLTGNTTQSISYFDSSLNVTKEQQVHYLDVVPEQSQTVWLQENDSYTDPERWYIEITDRATGKTYPAYIIKDSLVTIDGQRHAGLIILSPNQQEVSVYTGLSADSEPVIVKKQHIQSLHIENYASDQLFEKMFAAVGPVAVSEIRAYYHAQTVSRDMIDSRAALREQENEPEPAPDTGVTPDQATAARPAPAKPPAAVPAKKNTPEKQPAAGKKDQKKSSIDKTRATGQDELIIRRKKLILKKRIIKVLGAAIILWLLYMGYKLVKSFR